MADGVTLEGDLKSELTCLVCLSIYDRPYRLDCEHAFCLKCLQKLVKSDSSTVSCPACRTLTSLRFPGFLGIAKLPADLRLSRLVETYVSKVGREDDELEEEVKEVSYEPAVEESVPFEHVNVSQCSEVMHGYIPFDLAIERTQDMFRTWKKNLWLCPTDFPEKAVLMNVQTVSVPFYVFNVRTQVDFKATVYCPQDGRTSLAQCETTTDIKRSRIAVNSSDSCCNHPSRRWIQNAIGSTVTIKTSRDKTKNADINSWGTWLWTAAKPLISSVVSSTSSAGGCSTGIPGQVPCSASCDQPPEKEPCYEPDQNLEMKTKVGQTYVSSTQPMQRQLQFSGRHGNEFTNMLVCATFAMDHDLVASLMTGQSKDQDLSLLTPIKIPPPTASTNKEYLDKILKLVKASEGILSGNDNKEAAASTERPRSKKKKDKKSKKRESERQAASSSSSQPAPPSQVSCDPEVAYDELISTPAATKQGDDLDLDGFGSFLASQPSSSGIPPPPPPPQQPSDSVNDIFEDMSPAPAAPRPSTSSSSLPPPLTTSVYIPSSPNNATADDDIGDFDGMASMISHPPSGTGRVFSAALEKEDYFAPADIPSSTPIPESAHTTFHEAEIISPERKSEDAWVEQIWPHVQEKELEFTKSIIKSLEPKGAVVDMSEIELTVTDLKQKAILLPCYVATYKYEDQQFDILIHGRTGEVHGKRPWIGGSAYDTVKKEVEGKVTNVKAYIEDSLDHFGV
eukprot:TRINITY_DN8640_c0_g1_i1.p1 TRINITY_DN8640_c0_g1~~TRINITY_DN8640_c0_g1_i1.p1  ORF type:complete len:736 (+),score=129.20 TRINITY_DN8640_c0_g1_i1:131-2338(+)